MCVWSCCCVFLINLFNWLFFKLQCLIFILFQDELRSGDNDVSYEIFEGSAVDEIDMVCWSNVSVICMCVCVFHYLTNLSWNLLHSAHCFFIWIVGQSFECIVIKNCVTNIYLSQFFNEKRWSDVLLRTWEYMNIWNSFFLSFNVG